MSGDVLVQWQDESGAWQRGYPVGYESRGPQKLPRLILWLVEEDGEYNPRATSPSLDFARSAHGDKALLLVMPLYAKRPVAVWVEIGKLSVVPNRTD